MVEQAVLDIVESGPLALPGMLRRLGYDGYLETGASGDSIGFSSRLAGIYV